MRRLSADMISRLPELGHIELQRVAISFAQARKRVMHGLHASLTPLRFEGGALVRTLGGRKFFAQRLFDAAGREMLYILTFYLPRYQDLGFREKLETVIHELWHISPEFDGDLRRHGGRCYAHTRSQAAYDAHAAKLVNRWLARNPPPESYDFLRYDFLQLRRRHGRIYGVKIPTPKLIPVAPPKR
jgi:predicted metallopeptidase